MGILNITPDSFSDGGQFLDFDDALFQAEKMIGEGADIIDVGGESTRPGAQQVSTEEEMHRVLPLIEKLKAKTGTAISVDTSKAEVMREAAGLGVDLINDVRALQVEGALKAVADAGLPVCIMHMKGKPINMQEKPSYEDLFSEIINFFNERVSDCIQAGVLPDNIILDPGFGFGKTAQHNLALVNRLSAFKVLDKPLLVGLSRKSTIGTVESANRNKNSDRLIASVIGALIAVQNGASIVRVHDVAQTVSALAMASAIKTEGEDL
ncbi:MAG: dihydropteroate synthase [Candidatus Azotimanducaceae bacterium]|jgi:dihydropteroate synthase